MGEEGSWISEEEGSHYQEMEFQQWFTTFKLFLAISSISITVYQGSKCIARNLARNIADAVEVLPLSHPDATFPAITICPTYGAAYNKSHLKALNISRSGYRRRGDFYGNSSDKYQEYGLKVYKKVQHILF